MSVENVTLDQIKQWASKQMQIYKKNLDAFVADFNEDPCHALEWSDNIFLNSALYREMKQIVSSIEKNKDLDVNQLVEYYFDQVIYLSTDDPRSSSQVSLLNQKASRIAKARIYKDLIKFTKKEYII